jgi:hypothetical protein
LGPQRDRAESLAGGAIPLAACPGSMIHPNLVYPYQRAGLWGYGWRHEIEKSNDHH